MSRNCLQTLSGLACLLILTLVACREPEPVRIGFLGGVTGKGAGLAVSGRNGFLLAIDQANTTGGIGGRRVETVISDDRMDASQAVANVQKLFAGQVAAVVGPMTSQIAVAVVPEADRARIPLVSPTVSTNQLSGQDDYFLRVYYSNAQAAAMLAEHLAAKPQPPRLAAIYDQDNRAYTEDWLTDFRERYAQLHGELIDTIAFSSTAGTSFRLVVEQALAKKPAGLLLLANAVDSAAIAQQIAKLGTRIPLYATGWSYTDDLLQLGGNSVEGLVIIQSADQESRSPEYQAFARQYRERYQEPPSFPAIHAYDATRAVLTALAKGATDGPQLKAALLALPPMAGAYGTIAFDRYGDLRTPELHLAVVRDGAYRTLR